MDKKAILRRVPGYIAAGTMIIFTMVWTYWGIGEMYHEGWWGAWYNRLPYLVPGTVWLILTLIALTWPAVGGGLIILTGSAFTIFFMDPHIIDGKLTFDRDLGGFFVSGSVVIIGIFFIIEAFNKRKRQASEEQPHPKWWRRNLRYILAIGLPLSIFLVFSGYMLPIVLTRVDDGKRGAQLIEGNGVSLIWAPEGPGWNWQQPWGGYPSWNSIALYGKDPIGPDYKEKPPGYGYDEEERRWVYATAEDMATTNLCRYLSEDGLTLMDEPQDIWRMPTVDEYVRSLGRHGKNAGCVWNGELREQVKCDIQPDKESPLWATDHPVIYYWAYDEYDEDRGYFVCYNGMINATRKSSGNPRHSYRCVKEP